MTDASLVLEDDRLYTNEETAKLLTITPRQVAALRQSGVLACVRFSGAAVRHTGAQIRAFIAARSIDAK